MRNANHAILCTHVTPTLTDMSADLQGAKIFSEIGLRSGYHQFVLHQDSRPITTFSSHVGLFRYEHLFLELIPLLRFSKMPYRMFSEIFQVANMGLMTL